MSKVISFRMDNANPREAQALDVLNAWTEQGYNLRFVLTEALLQLGRPCSSSHPSHEGPALNAVLNQISRLSKS